MAGVGTWAWSARDGALSATDRLQLTAQALLTRAAALPRPLLRRLGLAPAEAARLDASALRAPDSAFAQRVEEHATALSAPWLLHHCWRTYAWGALLAQARGLRPDAELFFSACMLHDLGLTPAHDGHDPQCQCFAVEGARAAHAFALQHGWDQERSDRLAEAISLHLNVRVGLRHGSEAHLLQAGAAMDVIGARAGELSRDTRRQVEALYPRLEFASAMARTLQSQAQRRPRSRAAFLVGVGFTRMIRQGA